MHREKPQSVQGGDEDSTIQAGMEIHRRSAGCGFHGLGYSHRGLSRLARAMRGNVSRERRQSEIATPAE